MGDLWRSRAPDLSVKIVVHCHETVVLVRTIYAMKDEGWMLELRGDRLYRYGMLANAKRSYSYPIR